jgi:hypothetical protein
VLALNARRAMNYATNPKSIRNVRPEEWQA